MTRKKMRPAAPGGADRTSELQSFSTLHSKFTPFPLTAQAAFLCRRFGVAPTRAALVASLAFGEAPR